MGYPHPKSDYFSIKTHGFGDPSFQETSVCSFFFVFLIEHSAVFGFDVIFRYTSRLFRVLIGCRGGLTKRTRGSMSIPLVTLWSLPMESAKCNDVTHFQLDNLCRT